MKTTKILYVGNKLAQKGMTPTTVDTLGCQFEEFLEVHSVSEKVGVASRLIDMCLSVFKYKDCDYVIIDTYSSLAFYFAFSVGMCCRLLGKRYIPILHGGSLPDRLDRSKLLSKILFNGAYIKVSPSGYLKSEFEKRGFDNITIIPNNIAIKDYRFKHRETFSPKLLWVRAFAKTYNCEMAPDVLKIVLERFPDAELCMVGPDKDGSMQSTIERARELGVIDRLRITGGLTRKQWHTLSNDYDIFVSTTNFDNTPVSVIEAMALGLPVISTNVGGMPYIINNGIDGHLVTKGDANAMAEKIIEVIENPAETTILCAKARAKAVTYDWESVKRKWREILK